MSSAVQDVIEGTWDEIVQEASRFHGHRLRVLVLPNAPESDTAATQVRVQALREWLTMPRPVATPLLNDSRTVLYEEEANEA